jgi:hypothetical protein
MVLVEMGITQNWEQCGYNDQRKILLLKLLGGFIFICTLQCSLATTVYLALSWPFVIFFRSLVSQRPTYTRRSCVASVLTEISEVGWKGVDYVMEL